MSNIQSANIGKATLVLACAVGVSAASSVQVGPKSVYQSEIAEYVTETCIGENSAEVVLEESAARWAEFQNLVRDWKNQRGAQSSVAEMAMLPAYQQIIGLGPDAVPMILAELRSEGDAPEHWFWALAAITRGNPVPPKSRGKVREMAKAWLEWGASEGYVQLG